MMESTEETVERDVRASMEHFWEVHSKNANAYEMMLDSNAEEIGKYEMPEVLSLLPPWKGKDVLELGAGIGRFTGHIGQDAKTVIAVDFVEKYVKKNEENHGSMENMIFQQADVTKLDLPSNSIDIIFSNWLFMYLSDAEIQIVTKKMLNWLRKDGFFFTRESCYYQSGNAKLDENPTKYRSVAEYNKLFLSTLVPCSNGVTGFSVHHLKTLQSFIQMKNNKNQKCWLLQKVEKQNGESESTCLQEYLDLHTYTEQNLQTSEKLLGNNFVSPGGEEIAKSFAEKLELTPGKSVLDLGSAIGGFAFLVAKHHDVKVTGVESSLNMVTMAMEKNKANTDMVSFELKDVNDLKYQPSSYDVIYSNDSLHYVKDKKTILQRALTWLKPGGTILFSDYCCVHGNPKEDLCSEGFDQITIEEYGQLLAEVGFVKVEVQDKTSYFIEVTSEFLQSAIKTTNDGDKENTEMPYKQIIEKWNGVIKRCQDGDQKWGVFYAEKAP